MAVAYDANSTSNGTTSISWTHTPAGTPAGVYVFVSHCGSTPTNGTNSDDVTSVTYGGIEMDLVASRTGGGTNLKGMVNCYFLGKALPSGAQTIVVTGGSTSKYCFARTVTAATRNTKIQNSLSVAETSYTRNTTVNLGTISKSGVTCLQDTCILNTQTAVGRSSPLTSPAYSVDGTHERDWGTALTGVYRLTAVNSTDTQTGFIGSTDSGTGYCIEVGICVAEDATLAHRLSEGVPASDVLGHTLAGAVASGIDQSDNARASDTIGVAKGSSLATITRDGGSSFPLYGHKDGISSASGTTFTVTGISTSTANTKIVVTAVAANYGGTASTITNVAWTSGGPSGSTFTQQVFGESSYGSHHSSIWTADITETVSSAVITITVESSTTNGYHWEASVDALVDTASGVGNEAKDDGSNNNVTVNSVTENSWIYVGTCVEDATSLSYVTNTTELYDAVYHSVEVALGVNTTGTAGNINVGWSNAGSDTTRVTAALEIKAAEGTSGLSKYVSDGVPASDVEGVTNAITGHRVDDGVHVTDTGNVGVGKSGLVEAEENSAAASDVEGVGVAKPGQVTDNAVASDEEQVAQATAGVTISVDQTDNALVSDSEGVGVGKSGYVSDNAVASDSENVGVVKSGYVTDNAVASDSENVGVGKSGLVTDSAVASDSEGVGTGKSGQVADSAVASDSELHGYTAAGIETDSAVASDSENVVNAISGHSATDNALVSDTGDVIVVAGGTVVGFQSDSAVATDTANWAYAAAGVETDSTCASDALDVAIGTAVIIAVEFADSVLAGDSASIALATRVSESDSAVALDALDFAHISVSGTVATSDGALASDALAAALDGAVTKEQADAALASDLTRHSIVGPGVALYSNIYIWNGADWVWWNGSAWE